MAAATWAGDYKEENLHILLKAQCYFDKCEVLAPCVTCV